MRAFLAAAMLLLTAGAARAGMLLEADVAGIPVRLEVGARPDLVLAQVAGRDYRLDLGAASVATDGEQLPPGRPAPAPIGTLEPWSDGPLVAGYGTSYGVLIQGQKICGEALVVPWMARFTGPLTGALELLERTLPALAPRASQGCAPQGFAAYARDGFPLMIGDRQAPHFQVRLLRFDHYPAESAPAPAAP